MGNSQIHSLDSFPEGFVFVRNINFHPYGRAAVYKNQEKHYQVAMLTVEQVNFDESLVKLFSGVSTYILNFLDWCKEDQTMLCGEKTPVTLFYEYCPSTIEMEIGKRRGRGASFKEEEVWYVLNSIVELETDMIAKGMSHKDIRPSTVLVSEFQLVKFAPVGMFPFDLNAYNRWLYRGESCYLAPENLDRNIAKIDWPSNDVFAAGLTVLDMMQLDSSDDLYQCKDSMKYNIQQRLEAAKRIYSEGLCDVVRDMTQGERDRRTTFQLLHQKLLPYQKQILSLTPFQIGDSLSNSTRSTFNGARSLRADQQSDRLSIKIKPNISLFKSKVSNPSPTMQTIHQPTTLSIIRTLPAPRAPQNLPTQIRSNVRTDVSPIRTNVVPQRRPRVSPPKGMFFQPQVQRSKSPLTRLTSQPQIFLQPSPVLDQRQNVNRNVSPSPNYRVQGLNHTLSQPFLTNTNHQSQLILRPRPIVNRLDQTSPVNNWKPQTPIGSPSPYQLITGNPGTPQTAATRYTPKPTSVSRQSELPPPKSHQDFGGSITSKDQSRNEDQKSTDQLLQTTIKKTENILLQNQRLRNQY